MVSEIYSMQSRVNMQKDTFNMQGSLNLLTTLIFSKMFSNISKHYFYIVIVTSVCYRDACCSLSGEASATILVVCGFSHPQIFTFITPVDATDFQN